MENLSQLTMTLESFLQGGADRITSVAIPLAFVGVGGFMLFGGLANMYRGVGKRDQ
jgi:hypothetical protein